MKPPARLVILVVLAFVFAGGAVVAYWQLKAPTSQGPDLTKLGRAPVFELTSDRGDVFKSSSLNDRVWVVDFFFTRCRGLCPVLTQRMEDLVPILKPYENWSLISISVDPEYDTPEILTEYRKARGITSENWHFLTGEKATVRTLVQEGFLLPMADNPQNKKEPVLHSQRMILLDGEGNFRGFYDIFDEDDMQGLKRDAVKLLQ